MLDKRCISIGSLVCSLNWRSFLSWLRESWILAHKNRILPINTNCFRD